jgi:hypothetical protein
MPPLTSRASAKPESDPKPLAHFKPRWGSRSEATANIKNQVGRGCARAQFCGLGGAERGKGKISVGEDSGFRIQGSAYGLSSFDIMLQPVPLRRDFRFKISDFSRDGFGILILAFHPSISSFILSFHPSSFPLMRLPFFGVVAFS